VKRQIIFRASWWTVNVLLLCALVATIWTGYREMTVREYLDGFSDAVVSDSAAPMEKVDAILRWMRYGPSRPDAPDLAILSARNPQDTLNYHQLLQVCGSATNAFLNLSRSTGLQARRLLLLTPEHYAKHVVAEVYVDGRWIVVDPSYRAVMRDAQGHLLTRKDLQDPEIFRQATLNIPHYLSEYSYERSAHVRLPAFPFRGLHIRSLLDRFFPAWDENTEWTLLLERRSFYYFFLSICAVVLLLLLRVFLGWIADHRLHVGRFHLRAKLIRATTVFFTSPEIK
jgi:transglutaminase-like putative cysteine protease